MLQKVIKVGNSAAVTIPKSFMDQTNIKIGDRVKVDTDPDKNSLLIKTRGRKTAPISQEFAQWTKDFIEEYRPMLEELAKK